MEAKKISSEYLDKIKDLPTYTEHLTSEICQSMNSKIEELVLEGLKRKGFEFDDKLSLEKFVTTRCRVEDNKEFQEKTYFVDNTPFFLHKYRLTSNQGLGIGFKGHTITLEADWGTYMFL
ncbi:hypothetical protein [Flagellimonas sp. CMM7]|uniref:hypothetical protein n=1 Tax=Flagellimonas sp. CMM7 TaxID=2654676 RepID=UPI0013D66C0A|nr:hypothetical protein [Flagellimonas sp. CMM7]UII79985.1 hypothetical protein LV704_00340 [Flagellimonas sp. CMM7]